MVQRFARRTLIASLPPALNLCGHKARAVAALFALAALGLGGCAQQPQQVAAAGHPKEYFPSSVYGAASRRVIADGQPVPHGGGQYLVGKPYTIAGQTYYPSERRITQVGLASWYGDAFHGRLTANGEIYDRDSFTAAHPTMPLPSYARVTNLRNNTSMIVRVNDRGPYHSNRIMDVSRRVADALDIRRTGTAKVKVEWVARASLAGSDDAKLAATLRTDGPALANGVEEGIQLATAPARAVVASLGAFAPAPAPVRPPSRPTRFVEQERPDALEMYRAPHAAAPRRGAARSNEEDEASDLRRAPTRVQRDEADDETSETGSLRRGGAGGRPSRAGQQLAARREGADDRRVAHQDDGHRASRTAQLEPVVSSRDRRGAQRAETPPPPLRRPVAAAPRVLPPSRPVHLAALGPPGPTHKRTAPAPRGRSHDD